MPEELPVVSGQRAAVSEAEDTPETAAPGSGMGHHCAHVARANATRRNRGLADRARHEPHRELRCVHASAEVRRPADISALRPGALHARLPRRTGAASAASARTTHRLESHRGEVHSFEALCSLHLPRFQGRLPRDAVVPQRCT